jgi:hypothetical protein
VRSVAGPSEFFTAADLRERYHQQHHFPKPIGVGRRCVSWSLLAFRRKQTMGFKKAAR